MRNLYPSETILSALQHLHSTAMGHTLDISVSLNEKTLTIKFQTSGLAEAYCTKHPGWDRDERDELKVSKSVTNASVVTASHQWFAVQFENENEAREWIGVQNGTGCWALERRDPRNNAKITTFWPGQNLETRLGIEQRHNTARVRGSERRGVMEQLQSMTRRVRRRRDG